MRLKLWIVRPAMIDGGAERVTLTLLHSLDRTRFDLSLVLMRHEGRFLAEIPSDVSVYHLDAPSLWSAWLPLARLLRQHQPDILFSPGGTDVPAVIANCLTGRRARLVLSERNTVYHGELTLKRRFHVALKWLLYRWADQLTAVSQGVKDDMVQTLGIAPERIKVLYNPIVADNLPQFAAEPLDHPWFQQDIPIILAAGRLVPQKDFATLIHAFARLRQHRPARLLILGEGPLRESLEHQAQTLGVQADLEFAGHVSNPFKYMARCTIFVLSSLHEGLPGVLIQAMACRAPVISTDCPFGPTEIITAPGQDGLLVPVGDAATLAEQLQHLLDHPDLRTTMSANAQRSAARFDVATVMQHYVSALAGTESDPLRVTLLASPSSLRTDPRQVDADAAG
jgi:glycosyltransferase involved in cell wall biosynthesis